MQVIAYGKGAMSRVVRDIVRDLRLQVTTYTTVWDLGDGLRGAREPVVIVVLDPRHVAEARKAMNLAPHPVTILLGFGELRDATMMDVPRPLSPDDLRQLLQG